MKNNTPKTTMAHIIGVVSKRMNMPERICRFETRLIARGNPSSKGKIICAEMKGVAVVSQVQITMADNFGLWPQSEPTPDVLLCTPIRRMKHLGNHR
jgi:hypothetical protein